MKNAYRFTALLTCAAMLCSCAQGEALPSAESTESTAASEETTADTTPEESETAETTEEAADETQQTNYRSIYDVSVKTLRNKTFVDPEPLSDSVISYNAEYSYLVINDYETISFQDDSQFIRESSKALATEKDSADVRTKAAISAGNSLPSYQFNTPYILEMNSVSFDVSVTPDGEINVDTINKGYYMRTDSNNDDISSIRIKGFIRKTGEIIPYRDVHIIYEIIIDPAYMYGIPLLSKNPEAMNFNINGTDITADTLMLKTDKYIDGLPEDNDFHAVGENYVYAEIELFDLSVNYNSETLYDNNCNINSVKILSEDTDNVLNNPQLINDEKNPEMSSVYNAIINNKENLLTDDTYGIQLLDLDFDGTPEVLRSRLDKHDYDYPYSWTADVDIYRVKNGELKYIDTIYNKHITVYDVSNALGFKTLEDGTKAWFATSYKNRDTEEIMDTDYLYTLDGDKLRYTEIFGTRTTDEKDEYGNAVVDCYYMGKKMDFEIEHLELTEEELNEPYATDTVYHWNDYSSIFGPWEIFGFARQDYCEDIKEVHKLYSDWLCNVSYIGYSDITRFEVTDREFSYKIAYLVDAFYLGNYNDVLMNYTYDFLGEYAKPVIYLYPEEETEIDVSVSFNYGGEITCSYPEYSDGWRVTAKPDGTITDADGNEYYCLFWEGKGGNNFDYSKGWCIEGKDTADFLREKLLEIGLSAREANEFIIYWLPVMQKNKYNIISFHTEAYEDAVSLNVSPKPETMIRVFMTFKSSDEAIEIPEQTLPHFERTGFTVVEWGGSEIE